MTIELPFPLRQSMEVVTILKQHVPVLYNTVHADISRRAMPVGPIEIFHQC